MSELQALAERIAQATSYTDIFPDEGSIQTIYRKLVRIAHPDLIYQEGHGAVLATGTFQKLTRLKDEAEQMAAQGRYGEKLVLATIRTRRATHEIQRKLPLMGDVTGLYRATTTLDGQRSTSLIKVAKSPKDNDLLAAEARALKHLNSVDSKWSRHIPVLLDTFVYPQGRRRANALVWREGNYTAQEVQRAYPTGLDPRHVVWIWRRTLMALGFAHDLGVVHGAVLPPHILIEPRDHAVVLVDWCYSSMAADGNRPPIKAVVGAYGSWYPEEVVAKEPPSPATDLYTAARTMHYLLGGLEGTPVSAKAPRPLRAFFNGCLLTKQATRPQNAWLLLEEFDDLLEQMGAPFVPRRFLEFAVPTPGAV